MSLLCTLNDGVACSVGGAGSVYVCVHVLKPATRLPNAGSVCPAHELCKLISLSKTNLSKTKTKRSPRTVQTD